MVGKDAQGNDIVKIVDFGIAKVTEEESERCRLTKTGDVVGSPLYLSPEQCLGQPVDGHLQRTTHLDRQWSRGPTQWHTVG